MHILILAGGGGTRLWPLSREDLPKQFLNFGDRQSLLQKSASRFLDSPFLETISIATNAQYEPLVRQQLAKIDPNQKIQIIIEPARKNTAPAIAFAIKYLQEKLNVKLDSNVLILPSDHLIEPQEVFSLYLEKIEPLLQKNLILFGIKPTKPETGYGYIQMGTKFDSFTNQVKRFVEKPDSKTAETYLASGDYYWNSGMFAFSVRLFWEKLALHAPEINTLMTGSLENSTSLFGKMPEISFDYAILEKCDSILACPLPVNWSDVGCWDSVYDVMKKDQNRNVKFGNVLDIDTKNSLIIGGKRLISTVGLEDMLIVETDDATYISKKGESQKVKSLVQQLIKIGSKEGTNHTTKQFSWGTAHLLDEENDFSIQKILIEPGQVWESTFSTNATISLLEGSVQISINSQPQKIHSLNSIMIAEGQNLIVTNSQKESAKVLLLTSQSFFG